MTVFRIRRIAISIVMVCAATVVVTPFVSGALAERVFAVAVLAFPAGVAGIALRRTPYPRRAAVALLILLAVTEGAGGFAIGFEGSPVDSLRLMAGLALVPWAVLSLLYAWVFEEGRDPRSSPADPGERA